MRNLIVIEPTDTGFSAFSPDLEGSVATGATREDAEREMAEAIEFHSEGMHHLVQGSSSLLSPCGYDDRASPPCWSSCGVAGREGDFNRPLPRARGKGTQGQPTD